MSQCDPDRQGQIESGACLREVRGGQVHGHPPRGEVQSRLAKGRANAISALVHDPVGLPHDVEGGHPVSDVDLDGNTDAIDAEQAGAVDADQHVACPSWWPIRAGRVPSLAK